MRTTYNAFKYVRFAKAGDKVPVNPLEFNALKERKKRRSCKYNNKISFPIFNVLFVWIDLPK